MSSSQLDNRVITHAVRESSEDDSTISVALLELKVKGYTIIDSGLSSEEIDRLRALVYQVYERQVRDVGGEHNLVAMNDANIARALAAYDDMFIDVACIQSVVHVCDSVLGPFYTLMSQNGIINIPSTNHYQFTWHRDLNYQHYVSSRPLAISALLCIDPFSAETGGTYVLEGSHREERFPSDSYVKANQKVVTALPGQVIVFDAMLYHRTGANTSLVNRIGINHIYTQPFFKQQYSFPYMLGPREDIVDSKVRSILGYGFEPAMDVTNWRKTKLAMKGIHIG
jgi:ectoine hydroxylase-related dioxygenase (phytanoyl-CoA dioxygenase family)